MKTMKAILCTKYGPPEVLIRGDIPKPTPKSKEILVKIHATAVNSGDVRVRGLQVEGWMRILMKIVIGFSGPRKPVLGTVFAGVVEEIGNEVSDFKLGDRVFGMTGFKFGTYAEYITIQASSTVLQQPEGATHEESVALIFGGQTAIYFLEKCGLWSRQRPSILILGATGSVGVAATQLGLHFGESVTVVCGKSGVPLMEALGVKNIWLYEEQNYQSSDQKFDIVFDAVGKYTKKDTLGLLKTGGIFKTVGGAEVAAETKDQLKKVKYLYEKGLMSAVIDNTYSWKDVVDAHRYVDSGRKKGNVVLKMQ
jgi:NADPH:quinone reductase-like Zn-dependent oxidoreductase